MTNRRMCSSLRCGTVIALLGSAVFGSVRAELGEITEVGESTNWNVPDDCVFPFRKYSGKPTMVLNRILKFSECLSRCVGESSCIGWTWEKTLLKCELFMRSDKQLPDLSKSSNGYSGRVDGTCSEIKPLQISALDETACPISNVDFDSANSQTIKPAKSASMCSGLCAARVDCHAWTFIHPNVCKLTDSNNALAVEGVQNAISGRSASRFSCEDVSTEESEPECVLVAAEYINDGGNEIGNISQYSECSEICWSDKNCQSWSYHVPTKSCTLYQNIVTQARVDESFVSGVSTAECAHSQPIPFSTGFEAQCVMPSTDLDGGNISVLWNLDSPDACQKKCSQTKDCDFWSYAAYSSTRKGCFLKSSSCSVSLVNNVDRVTAGSRLDSAACGGQKPFLNPLPLTLNCASDSSPEPSSTPSRTASKFQYVQMPLTLKRLFGAV